MPRMTDTSEQNRESFEDALSNLGVATVLIDTQIVLHIEQAMRRDSGLRDLLEPAIDHVGQVNAAMRKAQMVIGEVWRERNENGWESEE